MTGHATDSGPSTINGRIDFSAANAAQFSNNNAADKITGVNYGFLLHKPEAKTLLNILSDSHPLYLFEMHLLALAFFVVLYLPFAIYDFTRRKIKYA